MKKLILAAALCAATAAAQAAPIQYNFTYDTGSGVLSGSLMGELQADQNTIVISSLLDFVKFDGVAGPSLPFAFSFYSLLSSNGATLLPGSTTVDGSIQDLFASDVSAAEALNASGEDGFFLLAGFPELQVGLYAAGPSFGNGEPLIYDATKWSIESAAAVPEPASLLLTGLALVGLVASRRKA